MGAQPSTPLAANDERFAQLVISGAIDPVVASSPFRPKQLVHCFKPCVHVKRCAQALPFPSHHEFAKRISQESWRQLNADLVEEMYMETPACVCMRKGLATITMFNLHNHRALYKVIGYYNRHLFHPMLIDAQIFAYNPVIRARRRGGSQVTHLYYVGFLVANSSAELLAFPRPQIGVSSGYVQLHEPNDMIYLNVCLAFPDFHLEHPVNLPASVPVGHLKPHPMHHHSDEYLRQEPQPMWGCDCIAWPIAATEAHGASAGLDKPAFAPAQGAGSYSNKNDSNRSGAVHSTPQVATVTPAVSSADTSSNNYGSSYGSSYGGSSSSARFTPTVTAPAQQQQLGSGRAGFFPFGQSMKREREW